MKCPVCDGAGGWYDGIGPNPEPVMCGECQGTGGKSTICKHDKLARSCETCLLEQEIGILQERLDRVSAVVGVIEQHGDLDATTLVQLRLALAWEPDKLPGESAAYGNDCPGGR